jgi:NTE family protein
MARRSGGAGTLAHPAAALAGRSGNGGARRNGRGNGSLAARHAQAMHFAVRPDARPINLALQGGGAHGAFGWGVLDRLLEDGRLTFEAISGTSAGSMNAVVLAYGRVSGGNDGAREALHEFWHAISRAGHRYSPIRLLPGEWRIPGWDIERNPTFAWFKTLSRAFSPYELNPLNLNPLREVLEANVDFERLNACRFTKLYLAATNVRTGKTRVFSTHEIDADVVMASACLPFLFQAVQIGGEFYWDGGYMGNPCLFPFFYHCASNDVLIVHINPIERPGPPRTATEIANRINEISFNSALLKEMRAIAFVQKLLDEGWLKDEYRSRLKYVLLHSIRADTAMSDLSPSTKMVADWQFLTHLRDRGRAVADEWLSRHFADVGQRSTIDVRREFLQLGLEHIG